MMAGDPASAPITGSRLIAATTRNGARTVAPTRVAPVVSATGSTRCARVCPSTVVAAYVAPAATARTRPRAGESPGAAGPGPAVAVISTSPASAMAGTAAS